MNASDSFAYFLRVGLLVCLGTLPISGQRIRVPGFLQMPLTGSDVEPGRTPADYRTPTGRFQGAPTMVQHVHPSSVIHVETRTRASNIPRSRGREPPIALPHSHGTRQHSHPIRPSQVHIDLPGEHGNNSTYPIVHRDISLPTSHTHTDINPAGEHSHQEAPQPVLRVPTRRTGFPNVRNVPQYVPTEVIKGQSVRIPLVTHTRVASERTEGFQSSIGRRQMEMGRRQSFPNGQRIPAFNQFSALSQRRLRPTYVNRFFTPTPGMPFNNRPYFPPFARMPPQMQLFQRGRNQTFPSSGFVMRQAPPFPDMVGVRSQSFIRTPWFPNEYRLPVTRPPSFQQIREPFGMHSVQGRQLQFNTFRDANPFRMVQRAQPFFFPHQASTAPFWH